MHQRIGDVRLHDRRVVRQRVRIQPVADRAVRREGLQRRQQRALADAEAGVQRGRRQHQPGHRGTGADDQLGGDRAAQAVPQQQRRRAQLRREFVQHRPRVIDDLAVTRDDAAAPSRAAVADVVVCANRPAPVAEPARQRVVAAAVLAQPVQQVHAARVGPARNPVAHRQFGAVGHRARGLARARRPGAALAQHAPHPLVRDANLDVRRPLGLEAVRLVEAGDRGLRAEQHLGLAARDGRVHQHAQDARADASSAVGREHRHPADVRVGQQPAGADGFVAGVGDAVQAVAVGGVPLEIGRDALLAHEDLGAHAARVRAERVPVTHHGPDCRAVHRRLRQSSFANAPRNAAHASACACLAFTTKPACWKNEWIMPWYTTAFTGTPAVSSRSA